jgi:HK97 family phage portal protein
MSILSRAGDRFRDVIARGGVDIVQKSGVAMPTQGYLPTLGSTPSATGLQISQGTSVGVSTVYACVTIRSDDFARCTPRLFRRDTKGKRVQIKPDEHPVAKLFVRPNRQQTWFEFAQMLNVGKLLRGNCYAAVRRDGRGQPIEFVPVNPDAVLVLESSDGEVFYNVNRIGLWQIAMLRDFPSTIHSSDLLHVRNFSFNALVGLSTIGAARDAIGLAMGLEQQSARLMANGAKPGFVLMVKKTLSKIVADRLKAQFDSQMQGINNTGATLILEEGIEPKPLTITSVDLEFMAQRNFSVAEVARFFKVPPHKLGAELMRGINIDQVNQDYVNNTVMPDLHIFEQKVTQYFGLDEQEIEVDMDETVLLRADMTARYTAARIGVLTGFLTPNEVREGENLAPMPDGDKLMFPTNMAAAGSDLTGTAPDGAGAPTAAEGSTPGADATDGAKRRH